MTNGNNNSPNRRVTTNDPRNKHRGAANHTDHNSLGHFATRISVAAMPSQHIPGRIPKPAKPQTNELAEEPEETTPDVKAQTHSPARTTKMKSNEPARDSALVLPPIARRKNSKTSRMAELISTTLAEEKSDTGFLGTDEAATNAIAPQTKKIPKKSTTVRHEANGKKSGATGGVVKSSSHKNHSITAHSKKTTAKQSTGSKLVHTSEITLTDKKKRTYVVDREKLSLASNQLQSGQIQAFWNAFMLFDHYETGVISAAELSTTLNHLGLHTNEKELQAIIDAHDDNGNGALDFEEYLNLMTDPTIFQAMMHSGRPDQVDEVRPTTFHAPNKPDYRDCLMYEVMNEFFNCKSLGADQEREIVGFYAKTLKHIHSHKPHQQHAAHVVHHYADGARSLGLTEKEIKEEIDKIREKQKHEKNDKKRNSPYAKPMQMIPRIHKSIEYKKKYNVMSKNNIKEGHLIWRGTPIVNYQVKLPTIEVNYSTTFENLKKIRKKSHAKNNQYRIGLSDVQKTNNKKLWSMLRYEHIPCERLKDVLKEVYGAYTTHVTMQPLDSKPRYVAYSIHDFKSVFPDFSDSEDEDDGLTLEEKRSSIHELSRKKLTMALKK